jgi:hypothetical protein
MSSKIQWAVGGGGIGLLTAFAVMSRIDGLADRVGLFLALFAVAFVAYVSVLLAVLKTRAVTRGLLVYVIVIAALCRAVLIPAEPAMSTDIYRYLWEGRAILHGFNPFALPPEASELEFLIDDNYEGISHKHMVTIYPPVAQGVFALAAWMRPNVQTQKILFVLFDLGTIILLISFLRLRAVDPIASVVYAWNPLVIFEVGHSGHLDPIGIFFLVLGLWLIARHHKFWGFLAMGVAFLAKYLSAIFIPYFLLRKKFAAWVGVVLVVAVVGYLPFSRAGSGLVSSFKTYSTEWQFNGLIYKALNSAVGDPRWTRWILTALLGLVVLYESVKRADTLRFAFVVIGTGLLLAPTLYPWYVAWVIPFLCFHSNRAWILFTGLVVISYWVWEIYPGEGRWELPWYLYLAEYLPFYGLLLFDAVKERRRAAAAR